MALIPDSEIRQIFACGVRNPGSSVQGIQNTSNDWKPESSKWNPQSKTALDSLCIENLRLLPSGKKSPEISDFSWGEEEEGGELYTGSILDYLTCDEIRILEPGG